MPAVAADSRPDATDASSWPTAAAVSPPSQSLPRAARLADAAAFRQVFDANDRRASVRCALVLSHPSTTTHSRLGLVVAKKHVRHATQRNRVKRLVREYFRQHPTALPQDIVFLARRGIAELSNAEIRDQLTILWRRLEPTKDHAL